MHPPEHDTKQTHKDFEKDLILLGIGELRQFSEVLVNDRRPAFLCVCVLRLRLNRLGTVLARRSSSFAFCFAFCFSLSSSTVVVIIATFIVAAGRRLAGWFAARFRGRLALAGWSFITRLSGAPCVNKRSSESRTPREYQPLR